MISSLDQDVLLLVLGAFLGILISILISWIAFKCKYYQLPFEKNSFSVFFTFKHVAIAFCLFFFVELLLVPDFFSTWKIFAGLEENEPTIQQKIVLDALGALLSAMLLIWLYFSLPKSLRLQIISLKTSASTSFDFLMGMMTWIIAYPWVFVVSQLMQIILLIIHQHTPIDQLAVQRVREVANNPFLLTLTMISVVIIVPIVEELLFRGFLQTYLKRFFGSIYAIIMTSVVFAAFHFSASQGSENLSIISALFVLSCYLGFIRERQQSILASIALHGFFNGISVLLILFIH